MVPHVFNIVITALVMILSLASGDVGMVHAMVIRVLAVLLQAMKEMEVAADNAEHFNNTVMDAA